MENRVGREKRLFHDRMGAAIGSGGRAEPSISSSWTDKYANFPEGGFDPSDSATRYQPFVDRAEKEKEGPPPPRRMATEPLGAGAFAERRPSGEKGLEGQRLIRRRDTNSYGGTSAPFLPFGASGAASAPPSSEADAAEGKALTFSTFYEEYCSGLFYILTSTFLVGTVCAWGSLSFLLWNIFPKMVVPVLAFAVSCSFATFASIRPAPSPNPAELNSPAPAAGARDHYTRLHGAARLRHAEAGRGDCPPAAQPRQGRRAAWRNPPRGEATQAQREARRRDTRREHIWPLPSALTAAAAAARAAPDRIARREPRRRARVLRRRPSRRG